MDDFRTVYRKYAITLMVIAGVLFAGIMFVSRFYKPAVSTNAVPPELKVLNIVLLAVSVLAAASILLLRKRLIDEVKNPEFKGDIAQTLSKKGLLVVAPSLVSLIAGFTMIFIFNIAFSAVIFYFYIFIGAYYIGFIRSQVWRDILLKEELKKD